MCSNEAGGRYQEVTNIFILLGGCSCVLIFLPKFSGAHIGKKPRGAKTLPGSPMRDVGWVSISVFQACMLLCSIFKFLFRCLKYFRTKLTRYWSTNNTLQSPGRTGLDFGMFCNREYNYHFLNTILSGRSNALLTVGPLTCSNVATFTMCFQQKVISHWYYRLSKFQQF